MTLSFRQIEAFRAVILTGTATAAAQQMSITQPAVSRLLKSLEFTVGFPLFTKDKGRLAPTARARKFYDNVHRYYMGLDELTDIAKNIRQNQDISLRISAMPSLIVDLLPRACVQFKADEERAKFHLTSCNSYEVVRHLQLGICNLGLTLAYPDVPGIIQEVLVEAPDYCAMHQDHHLCQKEVITAEDLRGEDILNFRPDKSTDWTKAKVDLDIKEIPYHHTYNLEHANLGYALIAQNLAIGFMPAFGAKLWKPHGVVLRKLEHTPIFKYTISYPEKHAESELILEFVEAVKSAAKEIVLAVDESTVKL